MLRLVLVLRLFAVLAERCFLGDDELLEYSLLLGCVNHASSLEGSNLACRDARV